MKRAVTISLALLTILLIACTGLPGRSTGPMPEGYGPEYQRYFVGREGIEARYEYFPHLQYFYGPDAVSEFELGVEVRNKGASYSRGAT